MRKKKNSNISQWISSFFFDTRRTGERFSRGSFWYPATSLKTREKRKKVQINLWQMHHVMRFRSHGGYLGTLIKTPDRISERPARGGHSFSRRYLANVRFWHLADKPTAPEFVRYWTNSGPK